MVTREEFFYPRSPYHGQVNPHHLVFNANLQEFAQKVSYIANLETAGKLTPEEACEQIEILWDQLKTSGKGLGIVR
jgi:hypothetical protein